MQAKVLRCLLWVCYSVYGNIACSRLSDNGEDAKEKGTRKVGGAEKRKPPPLSTVSSRFIFVFALSQFSGPYYLGAWKKANGNMNSFEETKKNCFFQKYMFAINRNLNYKLHFFSEVGGEVFTLPVSPLATLSMTYLVFKEIQH